MLLVQTLETVSLHKLSNSPKLYLVFASCYVNTHAFFYFWNVLNIFIWEGTYCTNHHIMYLYALLTMTSLFYFQRALTTGWGQHFLQEHLNLSAQIVAQVQGRQRSLQPRKCKVTKRVLVKQQQQFFPALKTGV
ncbi:hypothetical protein OS493_022411 [Desmophyllum pertusum]|uniref:Uncharacterized protein n=1 Tax=Desmophyllum pertusum TaxID=174260 RepID=A0A9W9ZML9_9CNID|nr:hypothetical protein OS493_022411 [Desmophyllum pertusum]